MKYKLTQSGPQIQRDLDVIEHLIDEYDSGNEYNKQDLVTYLHKIYICLEDGVTGEFDSFKWMKVNLEQLLWNKANKVELSYLKEKVTINVGDIDEDTTFADLLEKVSLNKPFVGYDSNGTSTFLGYLEEIDEGTYSLNLSDDYGYSSYEGFLQDRILDSFLSGIHYINDRNINYNCLSIIKNYSLTMEEVYLKYGLGGCAYIHYHTSNGEFIYFINFTGYQTDTEYQIDIWNNKGSITKYVFKNSTLKNILDSITLIPYELSNNKVTSISSSSTNVQYPSAEAVWNECQNIREVAEGKCKTWELRYQDTINLSYSNYLYYDPSDNQFKEFESDEELNTWKGNSSIANSIFNSQNNSININPQSHDFFIFRDTKKLLVRISDAFYYGGHVTADKLFKRGDILLILETEVPDRWFSGQYEGSINAIPIYKLETSKVELSGFEEKSNKVISISSSSTDTEYPSAKAVYDFAKVEVIEYDLKTIIDVLHLSYEHDIKNKIVRIEQSSRPSGFKSVEINFGEGKENFLVNANYSLASQKELPQALYPYYDTIDGQSTLIFQEIESALYDDSIVLVIDGRLEGQVDIKYYERIANI